MAPTPIRTSGDWRGGAKTAAGDGRSASMVPVTLPAPPASPVGTFELRPGDARELIRDVPDQSIDLICTDPPYNLAAYSRGNIDSSWRSDFDNDGADWDQGG